VIRIRVSDIDWRELLNSWTEADILYLKSICDEKLGQIHRRKILIKSE
jgi:hypothetical protein